jgi:acyl carrier protein
MMSQLKEELKMVIADIIEEEEFEDSDEFITDLGVDSMLSIEIVAQIEKKYKIVIPEEYLPRVKTLNDVYELVTEILEKSSAKEA